MKKTDHLLNTDLGINVEPLYDIISKQKNTILVDLGVRSGVSSEIMLIDSEENNNVVFGVDVTFDQLHPVVNHHSLYTKILGDSVTTGKKWDKEIGGLFVDTFHIKEQVMCELYYWYKHVRVGGFIAFHDSNWPEDKHDVYGDIVWPRVEEGIKEFFNIESLSYEDEYITVNNYPESWGMTIVEIKNKKDYISSYNKWNDIFDRRNYLINLFWNENNKANVDIELDLHPSL